MRKPCFLHFFKVLLASHLQYPINLFFSSCPSLFSSGGCLAVSKAELFIQTREVLLWAIQGIFPRFNLPLTSLCMLPYYKECFFLCPLWPDRVPPLVPKKNIKKSVPTPCLVKRFRPCVSISIFPSCCIAVFIK